MITETPNLKDHNKAEYPPMHKAESRVFHNFYTTTT